MKQESDPVVTQQQETGMVDDLGGIKAENRSTSSVPTTSDAAEQKLTSLDHFNAVSELKTASLSLQPSTLAGLMQNPGLQQAMSLHPMHQAPAVPQMPVSVGQHGENNACAVPEFELARRLGVRFDSSNAAWVARWTDAQNDRKKSRWFSVAKYGNAPARRLAIQACLHNMKPSDFPSLRDLQDVLATFGPPGGGPSGPGYLVPGADMVGSPNLAGVVRGAGVDHMGGKLGAQFGSQFLHHNPFAAMSGMPNPMAGYMAASAGGMPGAMGLHPGANLGMFVQGVPQQHATQGIAPQTPEPQMGQEGEATAAQQIDQQVINGQSIIKTHYDGMDTNGQLKTQFDQTTTASSSVASPSANGGVKPEPGLTTGQQQGTPGTSPGVRSSDPAFLQSLSVQPVPTTPPESASSSSSRFVLSGDSSSQESSDLDTRSIGSHSDDEDDDEDGKEGERSAKRKKRKLDEAGNAENTGSQSSIQQTQQGANAFGQMYNGQQGQQPVSAMHQQQMAVAAAGGQAASMHPSYYSLYGGYPGSQQMMLQQAGATQQGLHGLPFFLQPQMLPMLHPHFQQHAAAAAAAGFLSHGLQSGLDQSQYHHLMKNSGLYLPGYGQQIGESSQSPNGDSPTSATSPGGDFKRHNGSQSSSSSGGGPQQATAKMTCERGLHYSKCYRGNQECWIAVWNTKGGRIMHEAFDVNEIGYETAKQKAREARDAAHSNNIAVTENSRPSWKSHSNTGIPHVSLDSQQLRFRAHKFGRRLCRSFSFGRRRGSYPSRESAFDAAVLWLIQTPTDDEIAAVSGCNTKMEEM